MKQKRLQGLLSVVLVSAGGLSACQNSLLLSPPPAPAETLTAVSAMAVQNRPEAGVGISIQFSAEPSLGIQALNQPGTLTHLASLIRSSRLRLYRCTTQAAAQNTNPAGQAACTNLTALTINSNHPSGITTTPLALAFNATNLQQGFWYTVSVELFTGPLVAGNPSGTSMVVGDVGWPVGAPREAIQAAATTGSLSIPNDATTNPYAAGRLDLPVTLKSVNGGNVSDNRVLITEGEFAPGGEVILVGS